MASKLFLISGHGYEKIIPYESRNTLPAGTHLVTMSECGIPSKAWQLYNIMRAFMDVSNVAVLRDPISNKQRVTALLNMPIAGGHPGNTQLRIYGPGETYPDIYSDLYAAFPAQGSAAKSGVYTFPLDPATFLLQPQFPEDSIARIAGDAKKLDLLYSGSIFPPKEMQGDRELRVSIKELIEKFGPGVYYYPICRSPMDATDLFDLEEFRLFVDQFITDDAATKDAIARAETPQQMYDVYMGLSEETRRAFEKSFYGREQAASLRNELKMPEIRAKSAQRQRTRAGKRKTRGRKRTLRRKHFQRKRVY
jgi:hypothetical protein